jgi:hypothetical protein
MESHQRLESQAAPRNRDEGRLTVGIVGIWETAGIWQAVIGVMWPITVRVNKPENDDKSIMDPMG